MRILGEDARGRLVALVVTLGDVSRREHGHSRFLLARAASLPARRCGRLRGAGFASLRASAEIDVKGLCPVAKSAKTKPKQRHARMVTTVIPGLPRMAPRVYSWLWLPSVTAESNTQLKSSA